jgi:malonate transporter MadM subunit
MPFAMNEPVMDNILLKLLVEQGLLVAFVAVGAIMLIGGGVSRYLTAGRIHASAIAILAALALAWLGGELTGGKKGLADLPAFAGLALLGGNMLRDFAIVATAFEVDMTEARKAGLLGAIALGLGTVVPFAIGAALAWSFGYRDAVSMTTLGAGAVTYIVGPVTGAALGASSPVMALSIAIGVFKAVLVMVLTPFLARMVGLDNPRSAMLFGGLMGTVSGVTGGLAATNPRLVPYGALTATFHTGLGCLVCPSILYLLVTGLV